MLAQLRAAWAEKLRAVLSMGGSVDAYDIEANLESDSGGSDSGGSDGEEIMEGAVLGGAPSVETREPHHSLPANPPPLLQRCSSFTSRAPGGDAPSRPPRGPRRELVAQDHLSLHRRTKSDSQMPVVSEAVKPLPTRALSRPRLSRAHAPGHGKEAVVSVSMSQLIIDFNGVRYA